MTKAELIEKIVDAMTDPCTDCPEDYLYCTPIDEHEASDMLNQLRSDEDSMDLEPDERLPENVTPELVMIAYNCLIRSRKHEARTHRLAEYITDNEMVCEYSNYYLPELENGIDMIPVDFLYNSDTFPFATKHMNNPDVIETLRIGYNSHDTFNPNHEFCWFDKENELLHSTDHPFGEGILDAEAFAEYIMSEEGQDCFDYITNEIMEDDDFKSVFGCTKEEYINAEVSC